MKLSLFFVLTSAAMAVTPIVNLPPLDDYSGLPTQDFAGMLGWEFTVNSTVTVTGVGWFDFGKDGLASSVPVGMWRDTSGWWDSSSTPETIWIGSVTSDEPLEGDFRVLWLQQEITLTPGRYQLGGLHNGIDGGAVVANYIPYPIPEGSGYELNTNDVSVGGYSFYVSTMPQIGRHDFGPINDFYLESGVQLGPMLFIVPEPSSLMIGSLGMLVLLRRRRTVYFSCSPVCAQRLVQEPHAETQFLLS